MEFVDHLSLEKYLSDSSVQKQFNEKRPEIPVF